MTIYNLKNNEEVSEITKTLWHSWIIKVRKHWDMTQT